MAALLFLNRTGACAGSHLHYLKHSGGVAPSLERQLHSPQSLRGGRPTEFNSDDLRQSSPCERSAYMRFECLPLVTTTATPRPLRPVITLGLSPKRQLKPASKRCGLDSTSRGARRRPLGKISSLLFRGFNAQPSSSHKLRDRRLRS